VRRNSIPRRKNREKKYDYLCELKSRRSYQHPHTARCSAQAILDRSLKLTIAAAGLDLVLAATERDESPRLLLRLYFAGGVALGRRAGCALFRWRHTIRGHGDYVCCIRPISLTSQLLGIAPQVKHASEIVRRVRISPTAPPRQITRIRLVEAKETNCARRYSEDVGTGARI